MKNTNKHYVRDMPDWDKSTKDMSVREYRSQIGSLTPE